MALRALPSVAWGVAVGLVAGVTAPSTAAEPDAAAFVPAVDLAQALPGAVDPGRLPHRFEDTPPEPLSRPGRTVIDPGEALPPEEAESVTFPFSGLAIEGATALPEDRLRAVADGMRGRTVSLADVYGMVARLTALYRNEGYVLSRAILPPQTIEEDGVVRVRIVEGFVNEVIVEGPTDRPDVWAAWREMLLASRPLDVAVLERVTLLANDQPGITVQAKVRPAEGVPGAADLVLTVERKPVDAGVSVDNRGTRPQGPWEASGTLALNGPLGSYDRWSAVGVSAIADPEELTYWAVRNSTLLSAAGTRLELLGSRSASRPGDVLEPLEVDSASHTLSLGLTHPVIRTRNENLLAYATFVRRDSRTRQFGEEISSDRLRTLTLGGRWDATDGWGGLSLVDLSVTRGLPVWGASTESGPRRSRSAADATFTRVNLTLTRNQDLSFLLAGLSIGATAVGQAASQALLASEEFGYGGAFVGRGYDPSEITGDHGVAGLVEVRFTDRPEEGMAEAVSLDWYQVYGFWDAGVTWERDALPGEQVRQTGASAGIGVRASFAETVDTSLEVAKPLTRPVAALPDGRETDPRVFLTLSARF